MAAVTRSFGLFADLLDYPGPGLEGKARRCADLVRVRVPEAASHLEAFADAIELLPQGRREELYTAAFDLDATCHPYVGYHLFGETYVRSTFLVELKQRYRSAGFDPPETELPDRLSVVLRFLALSEDGALNGEILRDALRPALKKMVKRQDPTVGDPGVNSNVYHKPLEALRALLLWWRRQEKGTEPAPAYAEGDTHVR